MQTSMMRERAVAEHLGLSPITIRKMRITGDGPRFVKLGRAVVYDPADITAWLESRKVSSTSAPRVTA